MLNSDFEILDYHKCLNFNILQLIYGFLQLS